MYRLKVRLQNETIETINKIGITTTGLFACCEVEFPDEHIEIVEIEFQHRDKRRIRKCKK